MGYLDAGLYALSRILTRATAGTVHLICYHVVAQPVPAAAVARVPASSRVVIRQLDTPAMRQLDFGRPDWVIDHRLRQNAICFAAFTDSTLVGFIWLTQGGFDEDEVRCRFELHPPQRCAWDFDVFIAPRYRLGRLFMRLWEQANGYLRKTGTEWTMSRISAWNPESLAAHYRLGAHRLGRAVFLRAGPVQISSSSLRPWLHISWNARTVPVVHVFAPAH